MELPILQIGMPHDLSFMTQPLHTRGGGGSVVYSLLFIYTYLLLYLYVCPRSTPILYRIAHTFIAYTHFAHILNCARHARHNPYVGHARHQLYNDYARAGNQ